MKAILMSIQPKELGEFLTPSGTRRCLGKLLFIPSASAVAVCGGTEK